LKFPKKCRIFIGYGDQLPFLEPGDWRKHWILPLKFTINMKVPVLPGVINPIRQVAQAYYNKKEGINRINY